MKTALTLESLRLSVTFVLQTILYQGGDWSGEQKIYFKKRNWNGEQEHLFLKGGSGKFLGTFKLNAILCHKYH